MASASIHKLERLLECSVCLEKFTDPKAFECLHFTCQPCINYIKPTTEGNVTGYACPICRQFTAKEKIRPAHFMHELLEVVEEGQREHRQCVMCKAAVAKVQCIDCKEIYCSNCHQQHNRIPMLQNHKWENLDDSAVPVIDKHVYCTNHPEEQVKLHCKDCKELICIICNGTEHKWHTAETINEAVDFAVSEVQRHQERVKQRIEQSKEALEKASRYVNKLEIEYAGIEKEVDDKYDAITKKADTDRNRIRELLFSNKDKQIDEIKEWMKQTENKIKSQENVLSLSDATLNTAKHTSLLQALQSGVIHGLEGHFKEYTKQPNIDYGIDIEFHAAFTAKDNDIGSVCKRGSTKTQPLFIERPLTKIIGRQTERITEVKPTSCYARFARINKELWCVEPGSNTIYVYDKELNLIKAVKFKNIGNCQSVVKVDSGIVVATDKGLYQSSMDGSNTRNIVTGGIVDTCWNRDVGFALDNDGKIHVIKYRKHSLNKFAKEKVITLSQYEKDSGNTIQFFYGFIYICQLSANSILQYTEDGVLVSSHGTFGGALGQFKTPRLCGADKQGSLLIADCSNHRFQILTREGVWHIMKMNKVQFPYCAVIENDVIYVSGFKWISNYLSIYSLK